MIGLGEPRKFAPGVVDAPILTWWASIPSSPSHRPQDDVLKPLRRRPTYRFWSTTFKSDPSVIGKVVRLGSFAIDLPLSSASSNPLSRIPCGYLKSLPTL